MKRRNFLKITGGTVAGSLFAAPFVIADTVKGTNDRIGIALVGCGGMGNGDIGNAARFGDVVAGADADNSRAEALKKRFDGKPAVYQDYRKLLENKDVDVVFQATPDHWHTKINIDAMLAGKDVYGEKPFTLTVAEGQQVCNVVKDTKRVFQTGTQQRSGKEFQTAIELVRNGRIGKLQKVIVALPWCSMLGGPFKEQPVPANLDWDLYQGQAPVKPYYPQRCHSIFRWWYEYAGGMATDWGNHHIDIAHWGIGGDEITAPVSVEARGIFPNEDNPNKADCFNTPDRFYAELKYAGDVSLHFYIVLEDQFRFGGINTYQETTPEQKSYLWGKDYPKEMDENKRNGIMFIGDKGKIFVNRGGVYGKAVDELKENPLPDNAWKVKPSNDHIKNFLDCVRSREEPVAPAWLEHRSVTACHLTNISLRLGGRKLLWDAEKEQFTNDAQANTMLQREQREGYKTV
ncbi:NADH-dependent dehydrogenase [Planctomycetales bacterium]|nr:NADH-dependent dehydrogenase [Planctomycetales bacterium]